MIKQILRLVLAFGLLVQALASFAAGETDVTNPDGSQYTGFSNTGSILNTRHNLTQSTLDPSLAGGSANMRTYRNDYGQVCVYCHTPHGSDTKAAAPLWNRNMLATTYSTYDKLGTSSLNQTVYQPGAASLPCLSCHDGQQAVDAIINMPGAGRYNATPSSDGGTTGDLYVRWEGGNGTRSTRHGALRPGTTGQECLSCHSINTLADTAVDFTVFAIGTDLRNDHPVGITFPTETGAGTDWNTPGGEKVVKGLTNKFFDENGNQRMDKTDIRLYDTGNGPSVECASCHDPHGVPNDTDGKFNPTFLRKTNSKSAVCLTCHAK